METRANYAIVGLFSIIVLAAAFGFVWWFSGLGGTSDRAQVRVTFTGSVTGLGRGSSVLFNGLRVGEVRDIGLDPRDPRAIVAVIDVAASTPLRSDTRARIEAQGLAGVVALQLIGGQPDAPALAPRPGDRMPTIAAERSEVQDLIETVRNVARRTEDLFDRLGRLVEQNDQAIANTVRNVERFSNALGDNADGVRNMLASIAQAAERIGPLATQLEAFSRDIASMARQVDMARVNRSLDNFERFTGALADGSDNVRRTLDQVASLTDRLNRAADGLAPAMERVGPALQRVEELGRDAGAFVRQLDVARFNRSLDSIDRFTAALAANTGDVTRTLQSVASLSDKLNRSADGLAPALERLGPTLQQVEALARDAGGLVRSVDAARVNRSLENIDRFAAALGAGTADVTRTLQQAASMTEKLNKAADQVDAVLKAAQSFLGTGGGAEGQGAFSEVASAARSIRALADNLDRRTAEITAGINRFTGPGLRDIEALANDGRRTLNDLNRTLRSFERNPQQLLFGSRPAIPDYQGRR